MIMCIYFFLIRPILEARAKIIKIIQDTKISFRDHLTFRVVHIITLKKRLKIKYLLEYLAFFNFSNFVKKCKAEAAA